MIEKYRLTYRATYMFFVATEHWVRVREGGCDINEETLMMQPLATD